MKPVQRQKAVDACFRIPGILLSTSSDGMLTVPTTPGGGTKPHQKKRCQTERTTFVQYKHLHITAADVELDSNTDFV